MTSSDDWSFSGSSISPVLTGPLGVLGQATAMFSSTFSFKQIVNFPTRKNNILDLCFLPVAMPFDSLAAISPPTGKCDYSVIHFRALIRKRRARLITQQSWKFDERANAQFRDERRMTDWFVLFTGKDANGKAEVLEETVLAIAGSFTA
ncbi:hypothetical protein RvY_15148 [Ramazzottius varieornatus]|uniref:Uncharacterized protein n=1 Tax=Ramazzottius varieornatus TaxID=947166 RepID=A0A1D1W223_RAMVA|nr:hypothetical protein RvY_15148 [Ramazzottius varieornatus]